MTRVGRDKPLYRLPKQARGKATCAAIFEATARILETHGEARLNTNLIARASAQQVLVAQPRLGAEDRP